MKKQKFLRTGYSQYSKLGLRRKKKQVYRKANGTDNKVRLNMKGHLRNVRIGFKNQKDQRDLISGKKQVRVFNLLDLKAIKNDEIAIVAKIGDKNKIEIAKYALENNIRLYNLNPKKYIAKIEEIKKNKLEKKSKRDMKKIEKEKKSKEEKKKEKADKSIKTEDKKETLEDMTEKVDEAKKDDVKDIKDETKKHHENHHHEVAKKHNQDNKQEKDKTP